jgi:hypothetical protein
MKRFCPPMSWVRSPIVHGGGVGGLLYEYGWLGDVGMDVGEQFMKARSASCSASDGEGAAKEKSRKSAVMVVVVCGVWCVVSSRRSVMVEDPAVVVEVQQLPYSRVRVAVV